MDEAREKFQMAISKADYNAIIGLAQEHHSKEVKFSFCDLFKSMKDCDIIKLMQELFEMILKCSDKNLTDGTIDWTTIDSEVCQRIGLFFQAVTDICFSCMKNNLTVLCCAPLVAITAFFNDIILSIPDSMEPVKNCISKYCEQLCLTGLLKGSENVLSNVMLYLVQKTLVEKPAKADLKRLCAIREIFKNILNSEESISAQLWSLFLDCAVSQAYVVNSDGQKIIALIMILDIYKLLEIHEKIKSYVPRMSIKIAEGYGKIYFEAWCYSIKCGKIEVKNSIEVSCLQDFIKMGVEAPRLRPLIRKILNHFVLHKREPEVFKVLYKIYEPVIWRYLKTASAFERGNAAHLYLDIFPLEDPGKGLIENQTEVDEQILMIQDLLLDDFLFVRIQAVKAICFSMCVNFETFPERMLNVFFRIIVNDLSRDSSSPMMRLAVVQGLKSLLENPSTFKCLVKILPKLNTLFHDESENVRIAFCQLLLKIKKNSDIKYYEIVPLDEIFARLEEDCVVIKKCICNLLHNSYFPKDEVPNVWLGRCLEMIKTERSASRIFFSYVANFISVENSVKFMIQAVKAVHYYVVTTSSSTHMDFKIGDEENLEIFSNNITSLELSTGFADLNVICGVLDATACMCISLKPEFDKNENKCWMKMLVTKLGPLLSELCLYYKDTEAWISVFHVSGFFPPVSVPCLASLCFLKLKNLPSKAQEPQYITLLDCIINQQQTLDLLKILKEWLESGLNRSDNSPHSKRGGVKRKKSIPDDQPKPYLANRILHTLLKYGHLQKRILEHPITLQEIIYLLDNIKEKLIDVSAQLMSKEEADFLNLFIYNITRLSVHLHGDPDYVSVTVPLLDSFVKWIQDTLLKHIAHVDDEKSVFTTLITNICKNLCKVLADVTILEFVEPINCLYLEFIYSLLSTDVAYQFLSIAGHFLYKHAISRHMTLCGKEMMECNLRYLQKIFDSIDIESMIEKITETEFEEIAHTLGNVMEVVHAYAVQLSEQCSQVFRCILRNTLSCATVKCCSVVEEMAEDPFDRLCFPKGYNFYWSIINLKPGLNRMYVQYFAEIVKESSDCDISIWISYWRLAWDLLNAKSITKFALKDLYYVILLLENSLKDLYPKILPSENAPLQLFQHHCYGELTKLKNRFKIKWKARKSTRN